MGSFDEHLRSWVAILAGSWNASPEVTTRCGSPITKKLPLADLRKERWRLGPICTWALHQCVRGVDRTLREAMSIREFCARPGCIFRVAECSSTKLVILRDGNEICPGDRFGDLHLSNEKIGRMLGAAMGLGVGARLRTAFLESLRDLAWHAATDENMAHMKAFRAQVCWLWRNRKESLDAIIRQCGFTIVSPDPLWIGQVHNALENVLIYGLVWSFNPNGLRRRCPTPLRLQLWISREELLRRHLPGKPAVASLPHGCGAVDGDRVQGYCQRALDSDHHPDKLDRLLPVKEYHR